MDEEEYQREKMLNEYNSLRDEILQIYSQQMNLTYRATITGAAAIIATLFRPEAILVGLPILLIVLIAICDRSISNYIRIFRIGSYLCVVHEQQGKTAEDFRPSPTKAAWHTRWRKLSRSEEGKKMNPWIGSEGARSEALFFFLISTIGWIWMIWTLNQDLYIKSSGILLLSVILMFVLFYFILRLMKVFNVSIDYEKAFRDQLIDEVKPDPAIPQILGLI